MMVKKNENEKENRKRKNRIAYSISISFIAQACCCQTEVLLLESIFLAHAINFCRLIGRLYL